MLAYRMRYGQKMLLMGRLGELTWEFQMMFQDHNPVLCLKNLSALHRRGVLAGHTQSPLIITMTAASSRSPMCTV